MGAIAPKPTNTNYTIIKIKSNSPADVIMNYKDSVDNVKPPRTITLTNGAGELMMTSTDIAPASATLTQAETDEYLGDTIKPISYY